MNKNYSYNPEYQTYYNNLIVTEPSIIYGNSTTIIVNDLTNLTITPYTSVINKEIIGNETIFTISPNISTLYYISGYNSFGNIIYLSTTVYVTIKPVNSNITTDYNTPISLNVNGCVSYTWYPSLYLNETIGSSVICTPLKEITYTIQGTDSFNAISITYITVSVNTNLTFTPATPTVYDGNLLNLSVLYNNSTYNNVSFTWESNLFKGLKPNCIYLKYGDTIKLNPYQNIEYKVTAYNNNNIITEGYIAINVIQKTSDIIDNDIIPYYIYNYVIERNKNKLKEVLLKNKKLSKKIIVFYYTTLQTAYRMNWTNKNGISCKINWITHYQINNETNQMILSFEQQWKFFQYINLLKRKNIVSNFGYLLNIVNSIYLENVKKIPLYPMEPAVY